MSEGGEGELLRGLGSSVIKQNKNLFSVYFPLGCFQFHRRDVGHATTSQNVSNLTFYITGVGRGGGTHIAGDADKRRIPSCASVHTYGLGGCLASGDAPVSCPIRVLRDS